jgi:anti-sigma B factor antagonist
MAGPGDDDRSARETPFRLEREQVDDRLVIVVIGELDLATAPLLGRQVDRALADPLTSLAIDLSAVTFLDSSGLEALVTARRAARQREIPFTLASVSRQARTVIDLNGLNDLLGPTDRPPA